MEKEVKFACGHTEKVTFRGTEEEIAKKVERLEKECACSECSKPEMRRQDKENNKNCMCCRVSEALYREKYSYCKKRLTDFPKDPGYLYIFIPLKDICREALRRLVIEGGLTKEEALDLISKEFDYAEEIKSKKDKFLEIAKAMPVEEKIEKPAKLPITLEPTDENPIIPLPDIKEEEKPVVQTEETVVKTEEVNNDVSDDLFDASVPEKKEPEVKEEKSAGFLDAIDVKEGIDDLFDDLETVESPISLDSLDESFSEENKKTVESAKEVNLGIDDLFGEDEDITDVFNTLDEKEEIKEVPAVPEAPAKPIYTETVAVENDDDDPYKDDMAAPKKR